MKKEIKYKDFEKLDIRLGVIKTAEAIEGADKLLKLEIDLGEENSRTLVSGVAEYYSPGELIGKIVPVLVNLEPRTLRGVESQGMVLMGVDETDGEHRPVLLEPTSEVPFGSSVQ